MQIVIEIPESVKQAFDKATEDDIYGCYYDYNSIIGRAIKSGVPTEPCEDCVSRHEVMCAINSTCVHYELARRLRKLPPVTPKARWIPVSERLPNEDESRNTFLVTDSEGKLSLSKFYLPLQNSVIDQPCWSGMIDVVAWMPLFLEPYRKEIEGD